MTGRSAVAGCLSAYRPCNSPADEVRATSTSSGHRVRRCGHFGLTCRRTPAHNALCGTLTPQVIFTKPESFAVACTWRIVCPLKRTLAPALNSGRGPQAKRSGRVSEAKSDLRDIQEPKAAEKKDRNRNRQIRTTDINKQNKR